MILKLETIFHLANVYIKILDAVCEIDGARKVWHKIHQNNIQILQNCLYLLQIMEKMQFMRYRRVHSLDHTSTFWEIDCANNGDKFFKENFRMSRNSFNKLCGLMKNMKKQDTNYGNTISLEKRIAIAVFALGSAAEYRIVADTFGVGKATVCVILNDFCSNIWKILGPKYLNFLPMTPERMQNNISGFREMGFPQCIGALDGCHIAVHPKGSDSVDYYNYKGWHSMVLLALVNFDYTFLYINCGTPGRCNDSTIFENSSLKKYLENCELMETLSTEYNGCNVPVVILGDSAFHLSKYLMKPYPFSLNKTPAECVFNYKLSKCRRVVENAFGHLKARFRRIGKGHDNHMQNVNNIVTAACVLHNFLIAEKDIVHDVWLQDSSSEENIRNYPLFESSLRRDRNEGQAIRKKVSQLLYDDSNAANAELTGGIFTGGVNEVGDGEGEMDVENVEELQPWLFESD